MNPFDKFDQQPSSNPFDKFDASAPSSIDDLEKIMQTRDLTPEERAQYVSQASASNPLARGASKVADVVGDAIKHPVDAGNKVVDAIDNTVGGLGENLINTVIGMGKDPVKTTEGLAHGVGTSGVDLALDAANLPFYAMAGTAHVLDPEGEAKGELNFERLKAANEREKSAVAKETNPASFGVGNTVGKAVLPLMIPEAAELNRGTAPTSPGADLANKVSTMLDAKTEAGPASKAMKAGAGESYDYGKYVYSPTFPNKVLDEIAGPTPKTPTEIIAAKSDPVKQFAAEFAGIRDQPFTLKDAQILDERLSSLADAEYGLKGISKQGRDLLDAKAKLRNMLDNVPETEVVGGKEGYESLKDARAQWSQAMKMRDVERIQARAALSDNPDTTIKSGARSLLNNDSLMRGYTDEEIAALEDAAKTGTGTKLLKVFGSRLVPYVAGATTGMAAGPGAGIVAGGAGQVVSSLVRKAAAGAQETKLQNVIDVMAQNRQSFQDREAIRKAMLRKQYAAEAP
ncbi:MAG TPA: hypothetical protein VGN17_05220 [Bryobacteraceae bacterium]|jgi:hypothetical protein